MSDEILSALEHAHAIFRKKRLRLMAPVSDREYVRSLDTLFSLTRKRAATKQEIWDATAKLVAENRKQGLPNAGDHFEQAKAAECVLDLVFPFERRMTTLMRWIAVQAIRLGPERTVCGSARFRNWAPDELLALSAELGDTILAALTKVESARRAHWARQADINLRKELSERGLIETYDAEQGLKDTVAGAYATYEQRDRVSSAQGTLLEALERSGMDGGLLQKVASAYCSGGFDVAKELIPSRYAGTIGWLERKQRETSNALDVFLSLNDVEHQRTSGPFAEQRRQVEASVIESDARNLYRLGREVLKVDGLAPHWERLELADRDLFAAISSGLIDLLRAQKALAVDLLIRRSVSLLHGLCRMEELGVLPVNELGSQIRRGDYLKQGVLRNARLAPAIGRAIRTEQSLLRYYLEFAGPQSPWTVALALLHRGEGRARHPTRLAQNHLRAEVRGRL